MKSTPMESLKDRLAEIAYLSAANAVLGWDQEVHMPHDGADARATTMSHVSTAIYRKVLGLDADGLLSKLKKQVDARTIRGRNAVIVRESWRMFVRERKLPEAFVTELSLVTSKSQQVWAVAREKNDFKLFLPWLKKIVALKRKEAQLVGFTDSLYDALLDTHEPGLTTKEASLMLNDLKDFLIPFLKEIRRGNVKVDPKRVLGKFPLEKQRAFNTFVSEKMGFDYSAGRLDESTHPFTTNFHPKDVRITTRFRENDVLYSLGSTIHEAGHGLYEQGLPEEHFGTPLAEAVSLGVHESQSRMWENNIGKSKAFWQYFYPKLQKEFPAPFKKVPLDDFLAILNRVTPSFIRTEADEVTYNLHIIVRFELEKELIEGTIAVEDLPKIWNAKMKEYLGVTVPSDRLGVLQDVHWSAGLIGYFPTYSLGNLYAAQLFAAMTREIPDLSKKIAAGKFDVPREWLRRNIHQHGKYYSTAELMKRATGEYPTSRYFAEYPREKYQKLYRL